MRQAMTLRRRILHAGAGLVLAVTAITGLPGTALADHTSGHVDVGDGLLACNTGEICFSKANPANNQLKHYFYDDLNHGNNQFSNGGGVVHDNVSSYWNRDTQCTVYLRDRLSDGRLVTLAMARGGSGYQGVPSGWNDKNDGHRRCGPGT